MNRQGLWTAAVCLMLTGTISAQTDSTPNAAVDALPSNVVAPSATPIMPIPPGPWAPSVHTFDESKAVWLSFEYLCWTMRPVNVPALVTTAPFGSRGTLGNPNTTVSFGGDIQDEWQSGFRARIGEWITPTNGFDAGFFALLNVNSGYSTYSNGTPGVFRPFFNTFIGAEDAKLVAFVDPVAGPILSGGVAVQANTDLCGFEMNYRSKLSALGGQFDALVGYRYLRLQDKLAITTTTTTLAAVGGAPAGTQIIEADRFEGLNNFHGAQVGVAGNWQMDALSVGLRATLAVGVTYQRVEITGSTTSFNPVGPGILASGSLLALPTNIGTYDAARLAIAPEVGVTFGYQISPNIQIFGGYNALYWTRVVRAGDQINRSINGTYIPEPTTGIATRVGPPAPLFSRNDTYFCAHGVTTGIEFRW